MSTATATGHQVYLVSLKGYTFTVFVDESGTESLRRPHPRGEILQAELTEAEMLGDVDLAKKLGRQLDLLRKRTGTPAGQPFETQRAELRNQWQVSAVSPADARDRFMALFGITDAPLRNFTVEPVATPRKRRKG